MFEYRRIEEKDLDDLVSLYESVHGCAWDIDVQKKVFQSKFLGSHACFDKGKLIAFVGAYGYDFSLTGKRVRGVQIADVMTLVSYQRKGIYYKLLECVKAQSEKDGIDIMFAFPNDQSHRGFIKLGWEELNPVELYSRSIQIPFLVKLRKKLGFHSVSSIISQQKGVLKPKQLETNEDKLQILRDQDFIDYKTYTDAFVIAHEGIQYWLKIEGGGLQLGYCSSEQIDFEFLAELAAKLGVYSLDYCINKLKCPDFKDAKKERSIHFVVDVIKSEIALNGIEVDASIFDTF